MRAHCYIFYLAGLVCLTYLLSQFQFPQLQSVRQAAPSPLQNADVVYTFDLTYTDGLGGNDAYEHCHLVAAIAGLVNRDAPRFYYFYNAVDQTWLSYLQTSTDFLANKTLQKLSTIYDVVATFRGFYPDGVVLYDPGVWATAMLASTIAGTDSLLPICQRSSSSYKTLYDELVVSGQLGVKVNLVGKFTGAVTQSKKDDAYYWAVDNYMSKVNPLKMGYYLDYFWTTNAIHPYSMNTVVNQDYFISKKAFFFDLYFWDDEKPNDDPNQPTGNDFKTVKHIMEAIYNKQQGKYMTHIGGFTPWRFKYLSTKHDGVNNEWRTTQILSSYNAYVDADACCIGSMSNSAFYQHFKLPERMVQKFTPMSYAQMQQKQYINAKGQVQDSLYLHFYVGDYDSSAWIYSQLIRTYNDTARGAVPLGWAVNPNLMERFPVIFKFLYDHQTPNDCFTSGDSGAGYVSPTQILPPRFSGLPSAQDVWVAHNQRYFNQFNMKFTGFLINGLAGKMTKASEQMYESFSYDGSVLQQGYQPDKYSPIHLMDNTPFFQETDITCDVGKALETIVAQRKSGVQFWTFRGILCPSSFYKSLQDALATHNDIKILTPVDNAYLLRYHLGGKNNFRISYINDTIPRQADRSSVARGATVTIRNEGWNVIDNIQLQVNIVGFQITIFKCQSIQLQSTNVCSGDLDMPVRAGTYQLTYQLYRSTAEQDASHPTLQEPLSNYGNLPWNSTITVV